eukprot:4600084-Amphidinium_carterae.1
MVHHHAVCATLQGRPSTIHDIEDFVFSRVMAVPPRRQLPQPGTPILYGHISNARLLRGHDSV